MNSTEAQRASATVASLLRGAQLDTIRIYSVVVQLGFVRLGDQAGLPGEIWLVVSGDLRVSDASERGESSGVSLGFFDRRASALGAIYARIGQYVSSARVSVAGVLEIELGDARVLAQADQEGDLEEIWSVMSDSPEPHAPHQWFVSFDDSGNVSVRVPEPAP